MAELNKISSFKSFTEVKNQEASMKLRETNNAKRQETVGKIGAILDEMGLTSLSELDEEKKQALINKMFGNVSEDEAEDIEDELNKLGKPKKLEEGNAFIYAAAKAKNAGKKTFQFNGKTYKVTLKTDTGLKEDNVFEIEGETYKIEEAKRTKFTGKSAHDLYTQIGGQPAEVFIKNDWYSVNPLELQGDKSSYFTGYTGDGSDYEFDVKDIDFIQESLVNEARTIAKIQYDWSKLTTTMAATAQNWKAAEGPAKEMLLGKLKEMTAQKKALEAELDAAIADKDKDIELVVTESKENEEASNILDDILGERDKEEVHGMSMEDALVTVKTYGHTGSKAKKIAEELWGMCNEAFYRLPKDVIGTELYAANQNLQSLYSNTSAGSDVDPKALDSIIKNLQQVKSLTKKFNKPEEVVGTVYEGKAKDLKPNHKYTSDYGEVTFIKLNPDGKTMKLHSKETGEIKTDISNAYNMELIESTVNEADTVKSEAISRLADFFRISPYALSKFNFDGNDNIKELTKVLNSTSDEGTKLYYDTCIKLAKKDAGIDESQVNEAEKFKSTQDFEEFLEEIDGMPEVRIRRIMGDDYIDTPGGFRDEADDYDNDIVEYTLSNMGREDFEKLRAWWEENVQESAVNEGDMTKYYDGFIVLDSKSKKTYKFKYIKGTSNVNVENVAIDKLVKSTGESRANFAVHGFVKKGEWAKDNTPVLESVNEAAAKQFDVDFNNMVKNIKSGYGWIDPEYVGDTWENSSTSIDFELVKGEIFKRLFDAGLLIHPEPYNSEAAGKKVKFSELGAYTNESIVTESADFEKALQDAIETEIKMNGSRFETRFPSVDLRIIKNTEDRSKLTGSAAKIYKKLLKKYKIDESVVNEAEIKSDDEFKEYAMTVLKKAFGDDFDEAKAGEAIDGILKKCGDDYGACVGMLTSSLGESVVTEAFDANKRVAELAKLLKNQKFIESVYPEGDTIKVFVDSGDTGTTMMWDNNKPGKVRMECEDDSYSETIDDNDDAILNFFSNLDDELDESATNEAFDANYWEDYHEDAPKITNPSNIQIQQEVEAAVEEWNDNNEMGEENEVTPAGEKKV
jgi:hypothetical protein